jgi:hypothetical protein
MSGETVHKATLISSSSSVLSRYRFEVLFQSELKTPVRTSK